MSIIIAVDGHSSCGKSTLAKALAKHLHYVYGDSGAMYRAVTLYFLNNLVNYHDVQAVTEALGNIKIRFKRIEGQNTTFLNDENVEREIRTMRISEHVSPVSTIPVVRRAMVEQQQHGGFSRCRTKNIPHCRGRCADQQKAFGTGFKGY
jgi:CMP/dCMP kinase